MPLFRAGSALHYFAHVPKCGGQSVEAYLEARFGSVAFRDNAHLAAPARLRWTRTSPQHAPWAAVERLFPEGWIASAFALVRNPVRRVVSAYNYKRVMNQVPREVDIETWFARNRPGRDGEPFGDDGHLAPQPTFFPDWAQVFRLEDGMAPVIAHLDGLAGDRAGPREIGWRNAQDRAAIGRLRLVPLSAGFKERIAEAYRAEMDRFGYDACPGEDLMAAEPVGTRLLSLVHDRIWAPLAPGGLRLAVSRRVRALGLVRGLAREESAGRGRQRPDEPCE